MAKNTKVLTVLSTAAVTGLITAALGSTAFAKTSAILVQNGSDDYKYDYSSLASAFEDYTANPANGALYQDYLKQLGGKSPIALYDDAQKTYIDYTKVASAFEDAQAKGTSFNLNAFTEASKDTYTPVAPISDATVGSDGKVIYTRENTDLTVSSVAAINGSQAQVNFTGAVNASSVVPADFKVTDANGNQLFISKAEVSSTDPTKVILTFFDKFADKTVYTVASSNVVDTNGKAMKASSSTFAYAKADIAKVEFKSTVIPVGTTDLSSYIKVTDALGRDVSGEVSLTFAADKYVSANGTISGASDGNTAIVNVSVDGTLVKTNAVITFKTQTESSLVGYLVAADPSSVATDADAFSKLSADKVTHYVYKSDTGVKAKKLGLYYKDQYGNKVDLSKIDFSKAAITNLTPQTVILNSDGTITPVSVGNGYVKVKIGDVEQTVEIDVRSDAQVASMDVDKTNATAVVGTSIPAQVKLSFKDQYGTVIDPSTLDQSKLTVTVNKGDENLLFANKDLKDGNLAGTLTLTALKEGTSSITVEYKDATNNIDLVKTVNVTMTKATNVAGYTFEADTTKLDEDAKDTADTTDATAANIKVYQVDTNGNKIADVTGSATFGFDSNDTLSPNLVTLSLTPSGEAVTAAGAKVNYKAQNATVTIKVGNLQVGTITFSVANSTAAPAVPVFTNSAVSVTEYGKTVDTSLQGIVKVKDQFGNDFAGFDSSKLSFTYSITNNNGVKLGDANLVNGVSILSNSGTADVVVTGVYYNDPGKTTNLLSTPQVVKLSVKQLNPVVSNITVNGVSVVPDETTGTIDLTGFAGKDIVSVTGSLNKDAAVTVNLNDGSVFNGVTAKPVSTTDNFFKFVPDGKILSDTVAKLDGAKITVTDGTHSTVYTLKTVSAK